MLAETAADRAQAASRPARDAPRRRRQPSQPGRRGQRQLDGTSSAQGRQLATKALELFAAFPGRAHGVTQRRTVAVELTLEAVDRGLELGDPVGVV
jgi:hypothetical protein